LCRRSFYKKTEIGCGSQVSLGLSLARGARWLAWEVLETTLVVSDSANPVTILKKAKAEYANLQ